MSIQVILTDIEGTTTSLSFVKDVLFPYADQQMHDFVVAHRQDPVVAKLIDDVRLETGNAVLSLAQAIAQLRQWIAEDKKVTPLKALQGLLWEAGYRQGAHHLCGSAGAHAGAAGHTLCYLAPVDGAAG